MIRFDYPRLTIVIALVLGAASERNFHQSMLMGDGHGRSTSIGRFASFSLRASSFCSAFRSRGLLAANRRRQAIGARG